MVIVWSDKGAIEMEVPLIDDRRHHVALAADVELAPLVTIGAGRPAAVSVDLDERAAVEQLQRTRPESNVSFAIDQDLSPDLLERRIDWGRVGRGRLATLVDFLGRIGAANYPALALVLDDEADQAIAGRPASKIENDLAGF